MADKVKEIEEIVEKYLKAGKILSQVRSEAKDRIKVGVSLLEIAEFVENRAVELGADGSAFPCNISRNDEAAHATPYAGEETVFGEDVIKLDLGVHVDGYIADSAITIDLSGKYTELVNASRDALDAAIDTVKNGVTTADIAAAIEDAILAHDLKPVGNLTGHGLAQYIPHAPPSVPNRRVSSGVVLKTGDIIAIEPFATDGAGRVVDGSLTEIFQVVNKKPVRLPAARALLKELAPHRTLPFAKRWLKTPQLDFALMQLEKAGIVHSYPVLKEVAGGMVSQAEHTVIVTEDGCQVTTK
ncbi:methionine aminopeptidase, type II [Methanolobus vulcani]|jgi:methionine aminopeptidase, type II|uniref:Methionine aminopeptidase n=1 Tax=Methanolobus vulcani TaxID=38026 RepID=A0A7Z7AY98_9EURY|nr:type II methionyl aminopeptidase [Methanolobus vulcani]SDF43642.1 methionine aminopeptidase, type II [Methanolobus vulcani]